MRSKLKLTEFKQPKRTGGVSYEVYFLELLMVKNSLFEFCLILSYVFYYTLDITVRRPIVDPRGGEMGAFNLPVIILQDWNVVLFSNFRLNIHPQRTVKFGDN